MDRDDLNNFSPDEEADAPSAGREAAAGIGPTDIFITLFRHKWLILGFVCLGIAGAIAVRFLRPPPYVSWAKLLLLYVEKNNGIGPPDPNTHVTAIDPNGQGAINTEVEILRSADVAGKVAELIGPEKILARRGGGTNREAAAAVIYAGLDVEIPKGTSILTISFRHQDKSLVQPVLYAVLATYMSKHHEVRGGGDVLNEYYARQSDELRTKLAETEEELKRIKTNGMVMSVELTQRAFQDELLKRQEELRTTQVELASRQAILGDLNASAGTNASVNISAEVIDDYSDTAKELQGQKKNERALMQKYTPAFPLLISTRAQIEELTRHKTELERKYPGLLQLGSSVARGSTNNVSELDEIRKLNAKIASLTIVISNIQAEAVRVMEIEPRLAALTRLRNALETNAMFFAAAFQRAIVERELGAGTGNMSPVQKPTAPGLDHKKLIKLMGGVFVACSACGLALAFLIDFVLLRTIRSSRDLERLRLPVFLCIPDTDWRVRRRLPWFGRGDRGSDSGAQSADASVEALTHLSPAVRRSGNLLQKHTEGLRERLMTIFQVNGLDQKRPKLVALTSCGHGSGVSTLSSGLAAALSETGTGNVLLVDMNADRGAAQEFFKGKPGVQLTDALLPESRSGAQVKEHLYLAKLGDSEETNHGKLSRAVSLGFTNMLPRLKASDYDYVIFDMPPVSPTSSTPRLASHMDLVLMIVESEKTGQHLATRANGLLQESRAKVVAVLNKYRNHLPALVSPEA